jgi:hypothetical protein
MLNCIMNLEQHSRSGRPRKNLRLQLHWPLATPGTPRSLSHQKRISSVETAPLNLSFSIPSALPQKSVHLIENEGHTYSPKSFHFNQFHTALSLFSCKSFSYNLFPKTYPGYTPLPSFQAKSF